MRKILICLITLFIMIPCMNALAEEVKGESEVELLKSLNIAEWNAQDYVTRAQFVDGVMRCVYGSDAVDNFPANTKAFDDVPVDCRENKSLAIAKFSGFIDGVDDYNFDPDGKVSYEMAVKITVNAVGRAPIAESNGGYSNQASLLGITKKLSVGNSDAFTQGEAAVMLKNLLNVKVLKSENKKGRIVYSAEADQKTYLQAVHNVYSFEGEIITNENTSVDSTKKVSPGEVVIKDASTGDKAIFNVGRSGAANCLARRATVYYYDNDIHEIVFLDFKKQQKILEINGKEIADVYREDKKILIETEKRANRFDSSVSRSKVEFSTEINLIHNGIFSTDLEHIFNILNGESEENVDNITMYDVDNDGRYDVASVNTYYTINVNYTMEDENKLIISDRISGRKFEMEKDSNVRFIKLAKDGIDYNAAIRVGDTVSISEAKGEVIIYTLHVTNDTVTDIPVTIGNDKLFSAKAEYDVSRTLIAESADKNIILNKEYKFYLDHNDRIAGYAPVENIVDNYFYISRLFIDEDENDKFFIKGCTMGGEVKTLVGTDKLIIGSTRCTESNISYCKSIVENSIVDCRYDADGEVIKIVLPEDNSELNVLCNVTGIDNSKLIRVRYKETPRVFFADGEVFVAVTANTKVLHVPDEALIENGASLRDYCATGDIWDFKNDEYYTIKAYYTKPGSVAADIVVVYDNGKQKISPLNKIMVVGKAGVQTVNGEGNIASKIEGLYDGAEYEVCSAGESFEDEYGNEVELGRGDIIQLITNVYGDCKQVKLLYDHSADYVDISASFITDLRVVRGSVYSHDNSAFYMIKNKWDITENDIKLDNIEVNAFPSKIVICDKLERGLQLGTKNDVVDFRDSDSNYSHIVSATTWGESKVLVIYK